MLNLSYSSALKQKTIALAGVVAAPPTVGAIVVSAYIYSFVAVLLAVVGIGLARLVTIDDENKKLGRVQNRRETLPLTLIAVLIVCPFIWHFRIAIPWSPLIGLGVGYSVRVVLKIFGAGAAAAARAAVREAADVVLHETDGLEQPPAIKRITGPQTPPDPAQTRLVDKLDGK